MPPRINVQATTEQHLKAGVKRDQVLQQIKTATPAQINNYIDNNINSMAEAKQFLKVLAKAVAYLARNI